ncbi:tryptorubin family RiPP precursor [Amycolatopsis panacis]|nr:tryptorubin family RiPP precursor [Amycolatopsis panacis]
MRASARHKRHIPEVSVKFVRLVKNVLPTKSLKAYAWYNWL